MKSRDHRRHRRLRRGRERSHDDQHLSYRIRYIRARATDLRVIQVGLT